MSARAKHFRGLDGLRGVAAVCVLIMHLTLWFSPTKLLSGAGLAVDFFFCLSGFVIAHAYVDKILAGMGFGKFVWVRILRLYPLIVLGFAIGSAYFIFKEAFIERGELVPIMLRMAKSFALSLAMIPHEDSAIGFGIFPLNGVTWSLFFEFVVNVLYFFAVSRLGARKSRWLFIALCLPIPFLALRQNSLLQGFTLAALRVGAARVIISFLLGVLLQQTVKRWPPKFRLPNAGFVLLAILLVGTMHFQARIQSVYYELFAIILVYPAIIFFAATIIPGRLSGAMKTLGDISYPLYVLHEPVSFATVAIGKRVPVFAGSGDPKLLVTTGLIAIGASWTALKLYDEPVRAMFAGRRARRTARADIMQQANAGLSGQLQTPHR